MIPEGLQPVCARCRRRHLPGLRCWWGDYAKRIRRAVLNHYGDRCHLCGQHGATSADHLVPRSWGGTDELANLRPAHVFCNTGRGTSPLPETAGLRSPRW